MDRICNEALLRKVTTPRAAAAHIKNGMTVGFSGFTVIGYPKVLPAELARRAEEGEELGITVITGGNVGDQLDGVLARSGVMKRRYGFQGNRDLRALANADRIQYVDTHVSHGPYLIKNGYLGKIDVAVIEENLATADRLSVALQGRYLVIHGDGCDSKYQEDAGIRRADVFVATTGQDDDNLVSCEIAQRVFNVPRCIARVNSPKNLRIFKEVGIECGSSTTLIANRIEEETLLGSVSVASSLTHGNVTLTEIVVPRMRHHSNEAGILVSSVPMPENSLIAAVSPKDDDNVEVASEETVLYPGDKAIVVADNEVLDEVRALFKGL